MATVAARLLHKLDGLFAVYKPSGVHWKLVRDTVETNLLKAVNSSSPHTPQFQVQFQLISSGENNTSKELTVTAAKVPALADHPLVTGPQFHKLRVGVGHRLDVGSSGVLVLGLGTGNAALESLYRSHVTRDYTLEGEFGIATDDFTHTGRVIERSTYDHVTLDKLERVLAMIQGANQKALITYSGVDPRSQEAYELAVKGKLRPQDKSPPILTGLRCLHFKPPHFTLVGGNRSTWRKPTWTPENKLLTESHPEWETNPQPPEVQCVNETQSYLRKLLHEVGLELRTTAVCTKVRRTRDGPFKIEDALIHKHWTADDIMSSIANLRRTTRKIRKKDMYRQAVSQLDSTTENLSHRRAIAARLETMNEEKES
ncbi:mitochondrial mRNA pseudouridine synthase TRUB2 isoform X1 [Hoplias malabaricus]|uniref:mitochondrial mRNA pseudouridine synthase TRUB2 isoform X1 n=1 Tax=Hoplias malabaricus TaxID=27720 RepID=UPI0034620087